MNYKDLAINRKIYVIQMFDAAQRGDVSTIKKLLGYGITIHERFHKDFYAFREAASFGHTEVVELFLRNGADVHDWDDWALQQAVSGGHYDTLKVLLENGANVHVRNDWAYREAVIRGYTDIAKLLLEHGAYEHAAEPEDLNEA